MIIHTLYVARLYGMIKHKRHRMGDRMTIIERILEILSEKDIPRHVLRKACGIPQSTFSTWISANVTSIPSEYIPTMANYLGVSCDELLTGNKTLSLDAEQIRLIKDFGSLDWDGKQMVLAALIGEKRRMMEKRKGER